MMYEAYRPFDLARGPLLRAALLLGAPGGDRLILAVHHVAADLWSLEVLLAELGTLYRRGGNADLPPLPLCHADFARWQMERLAGPHGERLWDFWRQALHGGAAPCRAWSCRPTALVPAPRASAVRPSPCSCPPGSPPTCAALAAAAGPLCSPPCSPASRRCSGAGAARRSCWWEAPPRGAANAAGSLPVWSATSSTRSSSTPTSAAIPASRGTSPGRAAVTLAAFAHADYPFPLLAERLQPERDPGRPPVFQAMFALERARGALRDLPAFALQRAGARLDLGGLELESLPLPQTTSQFDVTFLAAELADGEVAASLHYSTDLFDAATAGRMAGHLARLLTAAAAAPEAPVWELPVLSAAETEELISAASALRSSPVDSRPVHALFAERARERPEAGAIVDGAVRLTYGELDAAADRLARRLRRMGVGPEVAVGILWRRAPERAVAILAVLKAGGGYSRSTPLPGGAARPHARRRPLPGARHPR